MASKPDFWTFICTDCGREQHSPYRATPAGWDFVEAADNGPPTIRCPDCAEMVEQRHFARHAATAPTHVGVDSGAPGGDRTAIRMQRGNNWCLLARESDGYRIVICDGDFDRTPVGASLTPTEALALAAELIDLVDLATAPGTLGSRK